MANSYWMIEFRLTSGGVLYYSDKGVFVTDKSQGKRFWTMMSAMRQKEKFPTIPGKIVVEEHGHN